MKNHAQSLLSPIKFSHISDKRRYYWLYRCECGTEKVLSKCDVISGNTISCGCYQRKAVSDLFAKHRLSKTRIYRIYHNMKNRCFNERVKCYKYYGGRGIKVCERWMKFENFYEDMKDEYSDSLTLDRIDSNGDYEPSNCRWATWKEQQNNRRNNRVSNYAS